MPSPERNVTVPCSEKDESNLHSKILFQKELLQDTTSGITKKESMKNLSRLLKIWPRSELSKSPTYKPKRYYNYTSLLLVCDILPVHTHEMWYVQSFKWEFLNTSSNIFLDSNYKTTSTHRILRFWSLCIVTQVMKAVSVIYMTR